MGKPRVAPRDEFRLHPVMLALSRARAAAVLLKVLNDGRDYLQIPVRMTEGEETETRAWMIDIAEDALDASIDEAEAALRASLTPEQAREQVLGDVAGPRPRPGSGASSTAWRARARDLGSTPSLASADDLA